MSFNTRIQHKRDTGYNWSKATNFIPLSGELIIYTPDTNRDDTTYTDYCDYYRFKLGDGTTKVNDLPFHIYSAAEIDEIISKIPVFTLPNASEDTLGGVKIGNFLSIDTDGVTKVVTKYFEYPENMQVTETVRLYTGDFSETDEYEVYKTGEFYLEYPVEEVVSTVWVDDGESHTISTNAVATENGSIYFTSTPYADSGDFLVTYKVAYVIHTIIEHGKEFPTNPSTGDMFLKEVDEKPADKWLNITSEVAINDSTAKIEYVLIKDDFMLIKFNTMIAYLSNISLTYTGDYVDKWNKTWIPVANQSFDTKFTFTFASPSTGNLTWRWQPHDSSEPSEMEVPNDYQVLIALV